MIKAKSDRPKAPESKSGSKPEAPESKPGPKPEPPESKSGSKPEATDDLKSLPMPQVQKKLGSTPDGLSQAEAQKRLQHYGPNEIEEQKANPLLKFLTYF